MLLQLSSQYHDFPCVVNVSKVVPSQSGDERKPNIEYEDEVCPEIILDSSHQPGEHGEGSFQDHDFCQNKVIPEIEVYFNL